MSEGLRILLIDDDCGVRQILAGLLSEEGYCVFEAGNGQDALALLQDIPRPDLILLDIFMPVMDGFEFRRNQLANERIREIPVIVLSADPSAKESPEVDGARDFFRKPLNVNTLLGTLTTSFSL